jgi:uncharacterized protein with ATP-grasp and redox domains
MKAAPDCIVCAFRQALNTARQVSDDPAFHVRLLDRLAHCPQCFEMNQAPTALSQPVYSAVAELSGVADPYRRVKQETNRAALDMLDDLRRRVTESRDPLDAALHAAVAGNIIDLGIGHKFDLDKDIADLMATPFAVNAIERFRRELRPGLRVLYVGDNAGEIVFDRLLVEHLLAKGAKVTFVVKSGPIINDATMDDAVTAGLAGMVPVMETGSNDIGVNWKRVSPRFAREFEQADAVIAKGHGNFETCDDRPENVYFLLKAKCEVVARQLGVNLGDLVFKSARGR